MTSNDATEAKVSSHEQTSPANPMATAHFSTFEDLSSRLVLLPFNDDSCTGAKVCSHVIHAESSARDQSSQLTECALISVEQNPMKNDSKDADSASKGAPSASSETETSGSDCNYIAAGEATKTEVNAADKKKKKGKKKRKKKQSHESDDIKTEDSSNVNGIVAQGKVEVKQKSDESKDNEQSQTQVISSKKIDLFEQVIPIGYVLVRVKGEIACAEKLDEMDFTDILSLLRDVAYPITLTFISPENYIKGKDGNEIISSHPSHNGLPSRDETSPALDYDSQSEIGEHESKYCEEQNNHSILASREDAAKFAAQAATELRGRLTRWGFQAATKAAEAACAVQEMREERQRKLTEEQSNKSKVLVADTGSERETSTIRNNHTEREKCNAPPSPTKNEEEVKGLSASDDSRGIFVSKSSQGEGIDLCHLFLQCPSGFVQLDKPSAQKGASSSAFLFSPQKQSTISLTNMSVITVRLSDEKACPVGKNSYRFQWFRSTNVVTKDLEPSSTAWYPLSGATYAAYQPSVSDVGYLLSCVVEFGEGVNSPQRCTSPLPVTTDPSLFESAKATLLKRSTENCASFTSLRDGSTGNVFRLRILVEIADDYDSIASSSVFIDQLTDGSFLPLHDESLPLTDVKARANPSRPRSFELVFSSLSESTLSLILKSSNNRLQLDAPNRNARESLLVALGFASFTGPLSSLTAETALLPTLDDTDVSELENLGQSNELSPTNTESVLHPAVVCSAPAKNLYTIQLEAQVDEMRAEVEAKASLVTKLQHKLHALSDDKKKTEKELNLARFKMEALSKCEYELREKDRVINEQERTLKSLKNEMAVLAATVELRDGKIDTQAEQIKELQKKLSDAIRKAEEERKLGADEARATIEADNLRKEAETAAIIADMKKEECHFQEELKLAQSIIEDLNQKYAYTKDSASKTQDQLERVKSEIKKLKMERNSLKNKADGLSKEMSKMSNQSVNKAEIRTLVQTIKQLQVHNSQLQNEVASLRSEKRNIEDELQATRLAHQQSARYIADNQPMNCDSQRAIRQCDELERVISNMTEHLDAKEMQICTLKQINEALAKEIDDVKATRK
ncbi:hypothetical protein HJC23_008412 [Cyclotella cryptica]|uniref:Uncharacterized protein n=1 Tax=Cyclotella cryptica TaxID=29204 RepID=A0ABD3PWM8_9STRA